MIWFWFWIRIYSLSICCRENCRKLISAPAIPDFLVSIQGDRENIPFRRSSAKGWSKTYCIVFFVFRMWISIFCLTLSSSLTNFRQYFFFLNVLKDLSKSMAVYFIRVESDNGSGNSEFWHLNKLRNCQKYAP